MITNVALCTKYGVLNIYGKSVLTTENDEWRRHLAIVGPSFNEVYFIDDSNVFVRANSYGSRYMRQTGQRHYGSFKSGSMNLTISHPRGRR